MENVSVVLALIGVISFVGTWFIRPNKEKADAAFVKIDALSKELADYKLHVAETYVTDTVLEKHFNRLEAQLTELKGMIKND